MIYGLLLFKYFSVQVNQICILPISGNYAKAIINFPNYNLRTIKYIMKYMQPLSIGSRLHLTM